MDFHREGECEVKRKRNIKPYLIDIAVILCVCLLLGGLIHYGNQHTEHEYKLTELDDGVYGIYTVVSSRVPADNYEMITLCCNGNVYTFKGEISIKYTDTVEPYVVWHNYNLVNGDDIWVYVPNGTIEFQKGVGV